MYINPFKIQPLTGDKLEESGRMSLEMLKALIVTPERCEQIMRRQPESESRGRPGILFREPRGSKVKNRKNPEPDGLREIEVGEPPWRVTQEFPGDESELEELETAVGVAAD